MNRQRERPPAGHQGAQEHETSITPGHALVVKPPRGTPARLRSQCTSAAESCWVGLEPFLNGTHPLRDWGPWRLDPRTVGGYGPTLYVRKPYRYDIDLYRFTAGDLASRVLDLMLHVAGKRWATRPVLGGLVNALIDVLGVHSRRAGSLTRADIDGLVEHVYRRADPRGQLNKRRGNK